MQVYPKATIFCPLRRREQGGNECAACRFYGGHKTNAGEDAPPAFYVECSCPISRG